MPIKNVVIILILYNKVILIARILVSYAGTIYPPIPPNISFIREGFKKRKKVVLSPLGDVGHFIGFQKSTL